MAEFFGKGISVGSGFDLGANLPLDNRTVQATLADRDSMPTIQLVEGLFVYVKENKTAYILKGFDPDGSNRVWETVATGKVVEIIDSLESDKTDAALSAAQGKALKTLIDDLKASVAAALDYKGTKDTYDALPTEGNKKGDVWNVVAAHGTTPAGTNYAWDGTQWDPLGGTVDLSGYYTKTQVDDAISTAKTELEAADTALEGQITTVTNQLNNKVDKVEGSGLISDTDLNQIRTNKSDIESLQASVGGKQDELTPGDAVSITEENVIDVKIEEVSGQLLTKSAKGLRAHISSITGSKIKVGTAITGGVEIGADQTVAAGMQALSDSIQTAVSGGITSLTSPDETITVTGTGTSRALAINTAKLVSTTSSIQVGNDGKLDMFWMEVE
jgi:predicted pyridoxine 5'-phosphate oxidase superfamily flavin-nucleotide-binding protein